MKEVMRLSCFRRENLIASLTLIAGAIWCHSDWPTLDQMKSSLFEVEETFDDSSFRNMLFFGKPCSCNMVLTLMCKCADGPNFEMKKSVQDFTVSPRPP